MDAESLPGSPCAGTPTTPLLPATPDRVNQQREPNVSPTRSGHHRDSSIHDKIQQFNNMSSRLGPQTAAAMTKQLERKTADAALKRAMLGREEAESEMRRFREEARLLRKQIEEGKERERRVGERLETVMENYGRAKETYSHTQALWEKEIRRARKETFKSQSTTVKLQEELKAAREELKITSASAQSTEEILEREKERTQAREQEAFASRHQLATLQEQLQQAVQRINVVEQERDAFKTLAHNEEVARIAAEGRLPLPQPEDSDDEFSSPKKEAAPLASVDVVSSAASEAEIEELTRLWQWERQRANRTQEYLEFLEAECHLKTCACAKSSSSSSSMRRSLLGSSRRSRPDPVAILDPADLAILGKPHDSTPFRSSRSSVPPEETVIHRSGSTSPATEVQDMLQLEEQPKRAKQPRRSMVFLPEQGTFRTMSQAEMEAMQIDEEPSSAEPPTPVDAVPPPAHYSRTPSVEPPTFAMIRQERTSLLSLLNAPRQDENEGNAPVFNIPTTPGSYPASEADFDQNDRAESVEPERTSFRKSQEDVQAQEPAGHYTTTTTTTRVPLREDRKTNSKTYAITGRRAPSREPSREPSFDKNNPAMTPTMTREQALAQIRERRGRARSAAQGAATPRRQMVTGNGERRDVSAPAGRAAQGKS
ncbi:hypothetical protein PFICI_09196 [Pestalotiopsis fici W106-1]|uniref:Uncharacterized protein n=1 Tax=Pestalotiopsis fici (strain W106-1 / CGMCC3.15140) TaxID=1229662 RepID=W3WZN5_PESFW|nr:uncharacterized protein PFICI_09196 [Pestalotiopsis fici W106-1]ETS79343.1 hypothetical protein PFICI_09196 [Pestalotiopsis fici W106-1]